MAAVSQLRRVAVGEPSWPVVQRESGRTAVKQAAAFRAATGQAPRRGPVLERQVAASTAEVTAAQATLALVVRVAAVAAVGTSEAVAARAHPAQRSRVLAVGAAQAREVTTDEK